MSHHVYSVWNFINLLTFLQRHIELDGDRDSELALELLKQSCRNKEDWDIVLTYTQKALDARLSFWSSIENVL